MRCRRESSSRDSAVQESERAALLREKEENARCHNSTTETFVEGLAQNEIKDEVEKIHTRIRAEMNYKRKDMIVDTGHIVTPDFEFWAECAQDADDPAMAVISHRLTNISPGIIDDGFNKVAPSAFARRADSRPPTH